MNLNQRHKRDEEGRTQICPKYLIPMHRVIPGPKLTFPLLGQMGSIRFECGYFGGFLIGYELFKRFNVEPQLFQLFAMPMKRQSAALNKIVAKHVADVSRR